MTVSELIERLEKLLSRHGDLPIYIPTDTGGRISAQFAEFSDDCVLIE